MPSPARRFGPCFRPFRRVSGGYCEVGGQAIARSCKTTWQHLLRVAILDGSRHPDARCHEKGGPHTPPNRVAPPAQDVGDARDRWDGHRFIRRRMHLRDLRCDGFALGRRERGEGLRGGMLARRRTAPGAPGKSRCSTGSCPKGERGWEATVCHAPTSAWMEVRASCCSHEL